MAEYIEREAVLSAFGEEPMVWDERDDAEVQERFDWRRYTDIVKELPAADVVEVRHGRWVLETHSFYRDTYDESCELSVYITAHCSECGCKHPNHYEVFGRTIYSPEEAEEVFRFDQKAEEEKVLADFKQRRYNFANYCPNCGTRMDGE